MTRHAEECNFGEVKSQKNTTEKSKEKKTVINRNKDSRNENKRQANYNNNKNKKKIKILKEIIYFDKRGLK
jgi:hypothetical protein